MSCLYCGLSIDLSWLCWPMLCDISYTWCFHRIRIHRDSCDCGIRTLQILLLILTLWKDGQRWLTCSYEDTWAWIMVWRNQSVEGSVHAFKWYKIVLALKICMKWISLKLFPIAFWVLYTHPYLSTLWNPIIRMSL